MGTASVSTIVKITSDQFAFPLSFILWIFSGEETQMDISADYFSLTGIFSLVSDWGKLSPPRLALTKKGKNLYRPKNLYSPDIRVLEKSLGLPQVTTESNGT